MRDPSLPHASSPSSASPNSTERGADTLHAGTTAWTASRVGAPTAQELLVPGLTILWHPETERVGERAALPALSSQRSVELSRLEPLFSPPRAELRRPLGDRHLSRSPIRLRPTPAGVQIDGDGSSTSVSIDGEPLLTPRELPLAALDEGVTLLLGRRVLLLLHRVDPSPPPVPSHGLVGESAAMVALRADIGRLVDLDLPVLLRGETGTGKELVARALHDAGPRRGAPFVAVDMASLAPTLAAAELFGAERGAYTGADRRREGHFRRAHGGTLFLDEIGETPPEVQALLLRTLETRQVRGVGAETEIDVDVRIVTATDADLEAALDTGEFRAPLLHRLSGFVLRLPPLRARRDDIGRLLLHRLRIELEALGEGHRLETGEWLPAHRVEPLVRHPWPGNVRQLANVVRQLVVVSRGRDRVAEIPGLTPPARAAVVDPRSAADLATETAPAPRRRPADIREVELVDALRAARWRPRQAAEALGIAPASIYGLIDKTPRLRKASELERDEIDRAIQDAGRSVERAAEALEVSEQALRRQMGRLGIDDASS